MASLHFLRLPSVFSTKTSIKTSMEELNALLTFACNDTISPANIGSSNETLLMDAVTTTRPQCL